MRITLALPVLYFGCLAVSPLPAAETVTVSSVWGPTISAGKLREWVNDKIVLESDATSTVTPEDVLSVQFARSSNGIAAGDPLVIMANGDRLVLRPVGVFEDVLTATWYRHPMTPALKLPLENVSAVIFDLPSSIEDRQRLYADLQTLPPGVDIVFLANGDRVQGEFERLDAMFVHLKTSTGMLKLDRNRVRAIRMNPELTNVPKSSGRRMIIALSDGSRMSASSLQSDGQEFKCVMLPKLDVTLPISAVVNCRYFGGRAIPVSDLDPTQLEFTPYLSAQWSLVKNANVLRGPLTVRGAEFGTGLGMHSRMTSAYELKGSENEFRSLVGIDDCARGEGSVRFAVELDGRRVWESMELTGRSPVLTVPAIKLNGARKLTLIVEFGKNADVADYADWCDPVLIVDEATK